MQKSLFLILITTFFPVICFGWWLPIRIESEPEISQAAFYGNFDQVKQLVNEGIDANTRGRGDITVLMWAVMGNKKEIIQYLVEIGADINATAIEGYTALHLSVHGGGRINLRGGEIYWDLPKYSIQASTVELLLSLGADVTAKTDDDGKTALDLAKRTGTSEIRKLLIEAGEKLY